METQDIRSAIPSDIRGRLLPDEKVLYYASGGGCLQGPRTYFLITESRVMISAVRKGGCLGIGASTSALDIPLEHISSVGTETSGCLFTRSGVVSVSSGTAQEKRSIKRRVQSNTPTPSLPPLHRASLRGLSLREQRLEAKG